MVAPKVARGRFIEIDLLRGFLTTAYEIEQVGLGGLLRHRLQFVELIAAEAGCILEMGKDSVGRQRVRHISRTRSLLSISCLLCFMRQLFPQGTLFGFFRQTLFGGIARGSVLIGFLACTTSRGLALCDTLAEPFDLLS